MILFTVDTTSLLPVVSIFLGGGLLAGIAAIYKARPEKDSVIVTSAQNASEILRGLNDALYSELKRAQNKSERCLDIIEAQNDHIKRLEVILNSNKIGYPRLPTKIQHNLSSIIDGEGEK